jgi:murein DD-endopeptidase MepM/ murein hydrolase activator NlpD
MGCRSSSLTAAKGVPANKIDPPGVYHEVKQGQTLWSIARAYGVDVRTLARVNQVSDTTALQVGQKLYVPGTIQQRESVSRCPCGTEMAKPSSSAKVLSEILRPPEGLSAAKAAHTAVLERVALIWPVQGEVSRGFEQDTTRRHDGVDIVAPRGTSVQAAADGEVIFSGWGPGGYGRIVILQHQAEVVTIYAHNHDNLVRPGQRVQQGEPIATVGQSGRAPGNHLHFEIRHRAIPISPHKFLPSRPSNVAVLDHSSRSRTTP